MKTEKIKLIIGVLMIVVPALFIAVAVVGWGPIIFAVIFTAWIHLSMHLMGV